MNSSVLTTVASFSFPYEAHIAKSLLASEDIPAFIADEYTINMQWLYSNAMGGVRVQVPRSLAAKAQHILNQNHSHLVDTELNTELNTVTDQQIEACLTCASTDLVAFTQGRKPAFIIFLLLGFPLFFYQHGLKCNDCGAFHKK